MQENTALSLELSADYLPTQSLPIIKRYAFVWCFTLTNNTDEAWQLIAQHWQIMDNKTSALLQEKIESGSAGQQAWLVAKTCFHAVTAVQISQPFAELQGILTLRNAEGTEQQLNTPRIALHIL